MIYLDGYSDLPLTTHTWAAFLYDPGSSDMLFVQYHIVLVLSKRL